MKNYLHSSFDLNDPDLVSTFDELPLWAAPFGLKLLDVVRMQPGTTALDVGFGAGFPLVDLAMRLGPSSKVYGIDPWKAGIERTRLKLNVCGVDNVELHEGVAEALPFADEIFDLVVSNNGINNVADIPKSLAEIHRVMKPGAQFAMTMNLEDTMVEFYDIYRNVLQERGLDAEAEKITEHIYARRKPVDEMRKLLDTAGFTLSRLICDTFAFRYADGTAMLNHYFIRLAFMDSWKAILPPDLVEPVFAEIEARLNTLAQQHGELRLSVPFVVIDCRKSG